MTIHPDALPMAGLTAEARGPRKRVSQDGDFRFQHLPDASPRMVRRSWLLSWQAAPRAVADAVWRHYTAHKTTTFRWAAPRTAEVLYVRWLSPPAFSFASPHGVLITAEIEQAEAHE